MALKQSLYDLAETRKDRILNKGYSYEGNIFRNTMSTIMFREEKRSGILDELEKIVFELIERVKTIKNHVHFTVGKNYRNRN